MRYILFSLSFLLGMLAASGAARADDGSRLRAAAKHWAFRPVVAPAVPKVQNTAWVRSPIDAFIAARHEAQGLRPVPEADRRTLIRRLSLDLTGLPPAPKEIADFLADESPNAYEKVVDRLLASPHYGERWGRHWLDLARWAESEGYQSNHARPAAWRYRDYVVKCFNEDRPFAQFVREQIAGDELRPRTDENLIATGFLAAARLSSNEENKARQRNDVLVDIVNTTAGTFLGLTFGCAQCHNHKFDPILQEDYYRFQAFFVKGQPVNLSLRQPSLWRSYRAALPAEYAPACRLRDAMLDRAHRRLIAVARKALSPEARAALALDPGQRTVEQAQLAQAAAEKLYFNPDRIEDAIPEEDRKLFEELTRKIEAMEKDLPLSPQTFGFYAPSTSAEPVEVLPSRGDFPMPYEPAELARARARVLIGGDVSRLGSVVHAGWPTIFGPTPNNIGRSPRLALADWLTGPRNPLVARVWVNRVWQHHFGRGIVATVDDFGLRGAAPTHPELLDWLAAEFLRNGGSIKALHRQIVCSQTYRLASISSAENVRIDADNSYLWCWKPRRLEAEAIRDSMLAVSGELDAAIGGPSCPQEEPCRRRTIYLTHKRDGLPAVEKLFDGPTATESCQRRQVSTTPMQPLYLLNSRFALDRARAFAGRVRRTAGQDREQQVETAYLLALGRPPQPEEWQAIRDFFHQRPAETTQNLCETCRSAGVPPAEAMRAGRPRSAETTPGNAPSPELVQFCQALINVNEFVILE